MQSATGFVATRDADWQRASLTRQMPRCGTGKDVGQRFRRRQPGRSGSGWAKAGSGWPRRWGERAKNVCLDGLKCLLASKPAIKRPRVRTDGCVFCAAHLSTSSACRQEETVKSCMAIEIYYQTKVHASKPAIKRPRVRTDDRVYCAVHISSSSACRRKERAEKPRTDNWTMKKPQAHAGHRLPATHGLFCRAMGRRGAEMAETAALNCLLTNRRWLHPFRHAP